MLADGLSSVSAPGFSVPRPPCAPASVDRLLKSLPAAARSFVLNAFLDEAREEEASTETILWAMQQLFADMRTGRTRKGLSSYMTHSVGFLMHYQFSEAPHAVRDLANYALYTVRFERILADEAEVSRRG